MGTSLDMNRGWLDYYHFAAFFVRPSMFFFLVEACFCSSCDF